MLAALQKTVEKVVRPEAVKKAVNQALSTVTDRVPPRVQETLGLWAFGIMKIPMLAMTTPQVIELTQEKSVIKIPLNRRTKNHLNGMYFAALAAGADCAGGLLTMKLGGKDLGLIFKDFKANFLKRAEGDVYFTCKNGLEIQGMIARARETGERQNLPIQVTATVPSKSGDEPVAEFVLTLSLKKVSNSKKSH